MSDNVTILMVDDERHISAMTREFLQSRGFAASLAHHAFDAMQHLRSEKFDLCILDVQMPMKDGFTLASEIRQLQPDMPIIFLTGKTDVEDRVKGLRLGAEDYITKPYSLEELELRIHNIIRRTRNAATGSGETYAIGRWEFSPATQLLVASSEKRLLTTIEAKLLGMFCEAPDGMLERDVALRRIWDDDYRMKESSLKVYISRLRKYFQEDPDIKFLNVHGVGYRLVHGE